MVIVCSQSRECLFIARKVWDVVVDVMSVVPVAGALRVYVQGEGVDEA